MNTRTMSGHTMSGNVSSDETHVGMQMSAYGRFAMMVGLSFVAMYVLMYSMVDSTSSIFNNVNQVYMAGLMAAPMATIEILLMRSMYPNKKLNTAILIASVAALFLFFAGIRNQTGVGDRQFLRSMIPHHSGAILMCDAANLKSADIQELCRKIIISQKQEIDQMKDLLKAIE